MEIRMKAKPGEVFQIAESLLDNDRVAKALARAVAGAAVALGGGMRFVAKTVPEDAGAEFDAFVVKMARKNMLPNDVMLDMLRKFKEADEARARVPVPEGETAGAGDAGPGD